jgi:hypothetical protein
MRGFLAHGAVAVATGLALVACGGAAPRAATITAVVLGPERAAGEVRDGLRAPIDGVVVSVAALPEATAAATVDDEHAGPLARARRAYIEADFPACRAALEPIDALALLGAHRVAAARVLVWRVACAVGEGDKAAARVSASALAAAGLALPPDITAVTPDVEALIGHVTAELAAAEPSPVRVTATPVGARVSVDGRDDGCVTPCTVRVPPGPHLVTVAADGYSPVARRLDAPAERELAVELAAAPPPVVAAQLQVRVARGAPVDDPATLALAARAVRARQIVVLGVAGEHLVGALYADGVIGARAERTLAAGTPAGAAGADLARELLGDGGVIPAAPLWRRPRFWISVAVAAALAATITAYLVIDPDPTTTVVFPRGAP